MHLAEGILPLSHALVWSALAAPPLAWSLSGEQRARRLGASPSYAMAGATSLLFAATLLPIPVPIAGATSHVCLTPVLALIVGQRRLVWPTAAVLLAQALFFAHGGITTLGINTLTLGLLGPLVTVSLWALLNKLAPQSPGALAFACALGALSVYVADASVLAFALADVADPLTTWTSVILGFAPVQIPLALLEAALSVAIVRLLASRRPDLLPTSLQTLRQAPHAKPLLLALLTLLSTQLHACTYQGIDSTVFDAAAQHAGGTPTESLLDLSQGELGLTMTILILFGLGFVAGRAWERTRAGGPHDTTS